MEDKQKTIITLEEAITIVNSKIDGYFLDYYAYNFPEMYVFSIMNNDYKEKPMDSVHLCGVFKTSKEFVKDPGIVMDYICKHKNELNKYKIGVKI